MRFATAFRPCAMLFSLTLLAACSGVNIEYDPAATFPTSGRYLLTPLAPTAAEGFDDRRVRERIAENLKVRGFKESSDHPDVVVRYGLVNHNKVTPGEAATVQSKMSSGVSASPEARALYDMRVVVAFVNPQTEQVIWQADGGTPITLGISPEHQNAIIDSQVDELLKDYPPTP